METYFASAERTDPETLAAEIECVSNSPVLSGLLNSIGGLLAVLDANRQMIGHLASNAHLFGGQIASPIHSQIERAQQVPVGNEGHVDVAAHSFGLQRFHKR